MVKPLVVFCCFALVASGQTGSGAGGAQQQQPSGSSSRPVFTDVASGSGSSNLLGQKIGPNDLIAVTVYDAPEFTRTLRVGLDGQIILPLMVHTITAAGLMPRELEAKIVEALRSEDLLKEPVVTVTVAEYQSRPITVTGAVRNPITFQAIGNVRLMEALTRAGGLGPDAGKEALVMSAGGGLVRRIMLKPLFDASDPKLDVDTLLQAFLSCICLTNLSAA